MKMLIAAVFLVFPLMVHAEYIPFDKQQPINFECQTGVKIHVVDKKHVVINGDFDAEVSELSDDRLQAQGYQGKTSLATTIDLRFMGGPYYSLLTTELDQTDSKGPWDDKVLGVTALICTRTQ
ncbi:hypothetical protein LVU62_00305 [Klebsiella variicola subsp. variicola]|uniref:hypothetical protein n=1 Tax=Klebsiella variicola TaxID=244366 RepID=UPI001E5D58E2|nr:hypothetical protein [Klebsiella variicola]MCE0291259.1 hypothetical protein [Klebsiella variicola subsp. variicola]